MDRERHGTLVKLSDTGFTVAHPDQDARGKKALDRNGEEIGAVDDLMVEEDGGHVRFLQVGSGGILGFGAEHLLIPSEAVTRIDDEHVHLDRTREHLAGAPGYDPALAKQPDYYGGIYTWYGYAPFWAPTAAAPVGASFDAMPAVGGTGLDAGASAAGARQERPASPGAIPTDDIPAGTEVIAADGEKVGEVVGAFRDYVVVEKGWFFPTDYYVPRDAVERYDGSHVYLTVEKDDALNRGWDAVPPELDRPPTGAPII